ncbi:magnesium and cobalt transporter [Loktanella ponticola]|uniref:Magnesium and cobalt transporter n=1 Tax=Yoonia ponticola TaxID=1524255 RepID=A0A7W9BNG3_9RHOB|nr:hemolysin family protein [Yoonia ponticola]MBB5723732.1 magnesium and cobalt transporter [Yoonia ponticola]
MGDTTDGSSNAAHSALDEENEETNRGFIGRFFDAFSGPGDNPDPDPDKPHLIYPQPAMPGMRNLRSMRVEDVSIPKSDIVAVPVTLSQQDLMDVFRESGMTRLPVYDGTLDTPLGNVNMKDFALAYGFQQNPGPFDLRKILRPLLFVPPSMPLGVLLQKMQQERKHMALVIDEYGGTDGLVTIEDLIEQVVGAIEDEHDVEEEKLWVLEGPGVYSALAKTQLEPFESEIGIVLTAHHEIDEEEIDTLGGLVFMLSGHVPARGEIVSHPDGVEFEVVDADPRRIKRLRVRLPNAAEA